MKFFATFALLALNMAAALAAPEATAEEQCGALGVYKVDTASLPEGVDPNNIRKCAEHPSASTPTGPSDDDGPASNKLAKRECWHGSSYGCSKDGWCWKQCGLAGSGQWCWTAHNQGYGPWIKCSSSSQCNTGQACGICSGKECGCSC